MSHILQVCKRAVVIAFASLAIFFHQQLLAQQLDATYSVEVGTMGEWRLKMVLNQPASFQFSENYSSSQNAFAIIIKNVYNSVPSSGGFASATGLTYTSSNGKSGNGSSLGTYSFDFGVFVSATDEALAFDLAPSAVIVTGETITIPAGTILQDLPGNFDAGQIFNPGPYTAFIANAAFTGVAATMIPTTSAPTLTTNAAATITATSAVLGGNITDNGGAIVSERGIVWSTNTNPTTSDNKVTNGSGNGAFSNVINGLPANTTIHVRAYAINAVGTSYGSNMSFTTLPGTATLSVKVFLEGAYNGTNLNTSLNASIPTAQPYNTNGHAGAETAGAIPANAVDWVLVELREAASAATALSDTKVGSTAGFLMNDGSIKATDGTSNLTVSLSGNAGTDFFVVIYHRNHLPVMSANAISESSSLYSIDFTNASANTYQGTTGLAILAGGKFAMLAGDANGDGNINGTDLTNWKTENGDPFSYGINSSDFNLDGVINAIDLNEFQQKNNTKTSQVPST